HPPTTDVDTLSLHDALPICAAGVAQRHATWQPGSAGERAVARDLRNDGVADAGRPGGLSVPRGEELLAADRIRPRARRARAGWRSEEHTSELQSRENLVCRL